jgi:N-acetyl-gamma-glutamyl-phosphate/LysW-gamma-L-alpha-aminoadipyl-6-phosphate reductase
VSKRFKAAVIGSTGYGGAEMIRRLLIHPEVELVRVVAKDHVGETLGQVHFNFTGAARHLTIQDLTPAQAAEGCDVVLLGVPHKVAAHLVPELIPTGVRIVDMSGDFRLLDAAVYERYYGQKHPAPELLGQFVYGLPEMNRAQLKGAKWVASPGCFATCTELGLLPLVRSGLLAGPAVVHTQGLTGSSGSGIAPQAGTHHPTRAGNLRTYKPLDHQHVPEILMALQAAGAKNTSLRFVPISAPLVRGMFVTSYLEVPADVTAARVEAAFQESYANEPFVRLVKGRQPEAVAVAGGNHCEVGFQLAAEPSPTGTRTLVVFSALDNLIKGGAGQAIQNMNLALGLPETLSLEDVGSWP